jgi:hypothetical protein
MFFKPHPSENGPEEEEALIQLLKAPYQLKQPIKCLKRAEVQRILPSTMESSTGHPHLEARKTS